MGHNLPRTISYNKFFKEKTYFDNNDKELQVHHEFSETNSTNSEIAVQKIITYIENKNNPFISGSHQLKNIFTEELVQPEITQRLLNVFDRGLELYENFRRERFLKKTKPLSALIVRNNLLNFNIQPKSEQLKLKKAKTISVSETQRVIALANECKYPLKELLKYELTDKNK